MRAALLLEEHDELVVDQVEVAAPTGSEVLVRTAASGLCHSDLHFMETDGWDVERPVVLGHEAAGVVEAVGPDVREVQPGDHVICCLSVFCGRCEVCLGGQPYLCVRSRVECVRTAEEPPRLSRGGQEVYQFAHLSSFAEEMLVHENALVKIRPDMPLDRAALIGCGVTTGTGAVFRTTEVGPGSTVAVIGCGGVGMSAVQAARIAGATAIIAVDLESRKLDTALRLGATHAVNPADGDPVAQVMELTSGGVDYSFEAIGLALTAQQAFAMIRRGGTATVMGMIPPGTKVQIEGQELFMSEKRLQGSLMGSNVFRVDMPRLVDLYLDGRLMLDEMVSATITLDDVNDGFAAMKAGDVVRSVIAFN
ncbi:Zn-dependent alcohol dehydrogenase [Candidatus Poriferisocius sp.]|uniref:Zn-dependent alcohol dehydrogenase n=1 Tax=Candidatus Poriferisocius sp. TaxID=3101276 RepID=UPI003B5BBD43